MHSVWIPKSHFSDDQVRDVNEALGKLFGVFMGEDGDKFVFTEKVLAIILKEMPQIRKWKIAYILLREKLYEEGINLSKDTLRKVRNQKKALKDYGIDPEEVIEIFEEFVRESTDRIFNFKKNEKKEE